MLIIYLLLLVFLLILFVLFTAISLTLKFNALSVKNLKEIGGSFTVKWLFLSRTFLIENPVKKGSSQKEPGEAKTEEKIEDKYSEKDVEIIQKKEEVVKTQDKIVLERKTEEKIQIERKEELEKTKPEGKRVQKVEHKEKKGIFDRIRRKKKIKVEEEKEKEKWMSNKEILYWGIKAFRSLRRPLFRLFSDLLHGIKIKHLESRMTFGLSDPADTGMLCGFIHPIVGLIYSRCRHCSFSINPVFMDPMLDFRGNTEIRVRIYSLIFPVVKFMFNRNTLSFIYSFIKEMLQGKWKSRSKKQSKASKV
jgi:hypothetical protein